MSIYKPALLDRNGTDIAQTGYMMKRNARSGKIITSQSERLVDSRSGEYNAGSKHELMEVLEALVTAHRAGEFQTPKPRLATHESSEEEARFIAAAFEDKTAVHGGPWQVLGEVMSDSIYETMGRMGWADKVLAHQNVKEGDQIRVRIHRKDVVCWAMMSDGHTAESLIKQSWVFPKLFGLDTNIVIPGLTLQEAGSQILEEKYEDGLMATMVREDRMLRFLFNQAAVFPNNILLFSSFTPTAFITLKQQVLDQGIPVPHMVMAIDLFSDIFADKDWSNWFDPVAKHELYIEGKLGKIADTEVITDGFRYPTLRVLNAGEVFFLGAPQALGMKTLGLKLESTPINHAVNGRDARGWFMVQRESLVVGNNRAVSKGQRA